MAQDQDTSWSCWFRPSYTRWVRFQNDFLYVWSRETNAKLETAAGETSQNSMVKTCTGLPCVAYTPPPPARCGWGDVARWWHQAADKASPLGESQRTAGWTSGWKTACRISHRIPDGKRISWARTREGTGPTSRKLWGGRKSWKMSLFLNKTRILDCNPTWSLSWVSLQHFHCWKTSASLSRPAWWKWRILYWLSRLAITSWPLVHASSLNNVQIKQLQKDKDTRN